jgi:hypothetical protein
VAEIPDPKDAILSVFHELHPRIPNLNVGDCHCNLLAEVALDALKIDERLAAERRAGREDAARDLRKIAVSSDEGNILRDLLDFAADVTEGMYTAAQVSLAAKVAAGNCTDESGADQPRTLHSSGEVQDNPEDQQCPARFSCESCRCVLDAGHDGDHDQHCQGRQTQ